MPDASTSWRHCNRTRSVLWTRVLPFARFSSPFLRCLAALTLTHSPPPLSLRAPVASRSHTHPPRPTTPPSVKSFGMTDYSSTEPRHPTTCAVLVVPLTPIASLRPPLGTRPSWSTDNRFLACFRTRPCTVAHDLPPALRPSRNRSSSNTMASLGPPSLRRKPLLLAVLQSPCQPLALHRCSHARPLL